MSNSSVNTSHLRASRFRCKCSFQSDICGRHSDATHKKTLSLERTSHLWLPEIKRGNCLKEKPERWRASHIANSPPKLKMFTVGPKCDVCLKDKGLTEAQEKVQNEETEKHLTRTRVGVWAARCGKWGLSPSPSLPPVRWRDGNKPLSASCLCLLIIQAGDEMDQPPRILRLLLWLSTHVTQNQFLYNNSAVTLSTKVCLAAKNTYKVMEPESLDEMWQRER